MSYPQAVNVAVAKARHCAAQAERYLKFARQCDDAGNPFAADVNRVLAHLCSVRGFEFARQAHKALLEHFAEGLS
jgi:hypothetical protein